MSMEKVILTSAGLKKYEEELHELKAVKRKEIADKIKVAREQGDLSENADYDAAKEEQGEIESRIVELEEMLKRAEVVDAEDSDPGKAGVGSEITLFDMEYDEEITYQIVGTTEADILKNKISNVSPIGAAVIGHSAGDMINVQTPAGDIVSYKLVSVKKVD